MATKMSPYKEMYGENATVTRFVITHVDKSGMRGLTFAKQGRHTYATREEAEASLTAFRGPQGLPRILNESELASLKVMECECWAGHFDPCGSFFEEEGA